MNFIQIAVDGTAGSGKTSAMLAVAKRINFEFIDTGLMYRAFTKFCILNGVNFDFKEEIIDVLKKFNCSYQDSKIFVNNEDYSDFVTQKEVLENINKITVIPEVRTFMVDLQQKISSTKNCIVVGRDITSIVLPNAQIKLYFDCDLKIRVKRRLKQNKANNDFPQTFDEIYDLMKKRDESDMNRPVGPLKRTEDSILVLNNDNNFEGLINRILTIILEKLK